MARLRSLEVLAGVLFFAMLRPTAQPEQLPMHSHGQQSLALGMAS